MKYYCLRCGLDFKQKNHFLGHLNRKNICAPILEPMSMDEVKKSYGFEVSKKNNKNEPGYEQVEPGYEQVEPVLEQVGTGWHEKNGPGKNQVKPGLSKNASRQKPGKTRLGKIECKFCGKTFTRTYGLTCHLKICSKNHEYQNNKDKEIEDLKKSCSELKETVEILMNQNSINSMNNSHNTTNNNTTNNNTTNNNNCNNDNSMNIHINNYGCENKDYITQDYLIKLLKSPFQAIPKLIEYTHFNKDHPENQNIKLPNKKQPYVKVLKDDKWIYADRKSTILDLIDEKHCELNDTPLLKHIEEKFSDGLQDRFERFNERYLNDEKNFTNQLYKETELVMINNS